MSWKPQDESTFRDRIVRIEKTNNGGWFRRGRRERGSRRGPSVLSRLPFSTLVVATCLLIAIKTLVLGSVSEGAYRAAALELREEGPLGVALATVFGPDPISTELSRHLRF